MKNIFLVLAASLSLGFDGFCQTEKTPVQVSEGIDSIACSDFNISVGILIVNVSTTVYICCGGPFIVAPNMPCSIVPKRTYELFTGQHRMPSGYGISVSDLLAESKVEYKGAKYIEVTKSSDGKIQGKPARIKKGRYNVDGNGKVYLEFEYL